MDVLQTFVQDPVPARMLKIFAVYREEQMLFPSLNSDNSEFFNLI